MSTRIEPVGGLMPAGDTSEALFGRLTTGWGAESPSGGGPSRRDVVRLLFKHRTALLVSTLIVFAVVTAGLIVLPPTYVASASLLIHTDRQPDPAFLTGLAAQEAPRGLATSAQRLETEMALIERSAIASAVVQQLGLRYDQVYRSPVKFFTTPLLELYDRVKQAALGAPPKDRRSAAVTTDLLQSSLVVSQAKSKGAEALPTIVVVSLAASDREVAERALQAIITEYQRTARDLDIQAGETALRLVRAEADEAAADLNRAEQALRTERTRTAGIGRAASMNGTVDPTVTTLRSELSTQERRLTDARRTFLDRSDTVQTLLAGVADLQARIADASRSSANADVNDVVIARRNRVAEDRYNTLSRRADEIALYVRANETGSQDRVVLDSPVAPGSSDWKRRVVIALVGGVLGFLLGLAFAGLSEYVDPRLETPDVVRRQLGIAPIVAIPNARGDDLRRALRGDMLTRSREPNGRPLAAGALQELAARLAVTFAALPTGSTEGGGRAARTVLVTSAAPGEGKTVVASAVAHYLAHSGEGRVLLVDAHFGHPSVPNAEPAPARLTFAAALASQSGIERVAMPFPTGSGATAGRGSDQLAVLPAGDEGGVAVASTSHVGTFLSEAGQQFDWIIIDAGSVGDPGVTALARAADATLVVIDASQTSRFVVRDAIAQLPVGRIGLRGLVLNHQRFYTPESLYRWL